MAEKKENKDKNILTSLNHALKIMDLLSVRSNLGVTEISRYTGYDKSSVYKMLYTMQHRGYVIKTDDARYALSSKLSANGSPAASRQSVVDVAAPFIKRLRDKCGETVLLGVLNINGKVIFTYKEEGTQEDSIRTRTAYEIDSYTNAAGKLLLSGLDAPMQDTIINSLTLFPHTPNTVRDKTLLIKELEALKSADFAEQYDENYIGHSDLAAPIRDNTSRCIAAISIACPTDRAKEKRDEFLPLLLESASSISTQMGYAGNQQKEHA